MRGGLQSAAVIGALMLAAGWTAAAHACKDETAAVAAIAFKGQIHLDQRDAPQGFAYAMVREKGHWIYSQGETRDLKAAMAAYNKRPGDLLWFRIGDRKYVTRDPEVLATALESFNTQDDLSNEDTQLGDLQAQLSDEAARLSDKSAALNDRQAEFADRMSDIATRIAEVRDSKARGLLQQKMVELREGLTELIPMQQVLASQQRLLARRAADLANQRKKLQVSKVEFIKGIEESIQDLLADAVANGQAEKI